MTSNQTAEKLMTWQRMNCIRRKCLMERHQKLNKKMLPEGHNAALDSFSQPGFKKLNQTNKQTKNVHEECIKCTAWEARSYTCSSLLDKLPGLSWCVCSFHHLQLHIYLQWRGQCMFADVFQFQFSAHVIISHQASNILKVSQYTSLNMLGSVCKLCKTCSLHFVLKINVLNQILVCSVLPFELLSE